MIRLAAAACLALAAAPVPARNLEGVEVPEAISPDGTPLLLNGAGLRRATIFNVKVYLGALYLAELSKDAEAVVEADAPKSVQLTFLRDVERHKVMGAFRDGFEKNSPAQAKALEPALERIATVVADPMKPKQTLHFTYLPGKGTTVVGPGGTVTIPGKELADALFRNWLGPKPADDGLKKAMLGS